VETPPISFEFYFKGKHCLTLKLKCGRPLPYTKANKTGGTSARNL